MKNPQDELIWQGRLHLGDEPGVYGDAAYTGLCAEHPITVKPFDATSNKEDLTFEIEAEDVQVFTGYSGHAVTVFAYEPDPTAGPNKWRQVTLQTARLTGNSLNIKITSLKRHKYVSIQVRVDTTVAAGLYNDFVIVRLAIKSTTHYAVLGFED
ncbi:MAG TPA: hypothetical protein VNH83_18380 [Bryobacteraceae bacterium]|nr:hypothetical protein [Bryobacteraceae bacterium]